MNKILNIVAVVILALSLLTCFLAICLIGVHMILILIAPQYATWKDAVMVVGVSLPISALVMWSIHRSYNPRA